MILVSSIVNLYRFETFTLKWHVSDNLHLPHNNKDNFLKARPVVPVLNYFFFQNYTLPREIWVFSNQVFSSERAVKSSNVMLNVTTNCGSLVFVPCIIRRSRNNQHYELICTTALFTILAPTCLGTSVPSSGSFVDPPELLEMQIE
jgi:hypothetical protein